LNNRSLPAASDPTLLPSQLEMTHLLKSRLTSLPRFAFALAVAFAALGLSSCHSAAYYYYKFPQYTYAGRPIPNSHLAQRVMISETSNGTSGTLAIVDASRDIRSNVENTVPTFAISGYSSGSPTTIFNFPAELVGYVYSANDTSLMKINYTSESSAGSQGTFQAGQNTIAVPPTFSRIYGASENIGILQIIDFLTPSGDYFLNIPNVYKVATNKGDTVTLAFVRNSNAVYRVFKLNLNQYPTSQAAMAVTGAVDCQPQIYPVYCAVPVPGTYDRPINAYFSLDGATAYVLNCGPECGGTTASITQLQQGPLNNNVIPTSPVQPNPQIANIPVPGGATAASRTATRFTSQDNNFSPTVSSKASSPP